MPTTTATELAQLGSVVTVNSGNVGIGSTSPQAVLDLGSATGGRAITWAGATGADRYNSIFSSYSGAALVFASGFHGSTSADSYISSYTGTQGLAGIRFDSVGANDGTIKFFTNERVARTAGAAVVPTERMRIDSSGNVGVNTTSSAAKLDVRTTGNAWAGRFLNSSASGTPAGVQIVVGQDSTNAVLDVAQGIDYTTTTSLLRVNGSGNVGIGNDNPAVKLEVNGIVRIGSGNDYQFNSTLGMNGESTGAAGYLRFFTNTTERLRIDGSGNVGIGTNSPDGLLHVSNNENGTTTAPQFRISGAESVYEALHYLDATAYHIAQRSASREIRVYSGTNAALGVKLTNQAVSWASISDSRLKDIIEPITNCLDKIENINPVIGKYKSDESNTRRSFVIGQDVQEVFPEAINVDSEGYISVRYSDLIPLLIGGIKEFKSENDSLKARIEALEAA